MWAWLRWAYDTLASLTWRRRPAPVVSKRQQIDVVRAKLERARRRYDKFVEPKGPEPKKVERAAPKPRPPKPPTVPVAPEPDNEHSDWPVIYQDTKRGEQVLIEESELYGEFNFRDTILDQLDRYFVYLKRMRKRDAESFALYKKIGITIIPYGLQWSDLQFLGREEKDDDPYTPPVELPPYFKAHRPSFGCFAYGANPHVEKLEVDSDKGKRHMWVPKFLYFTKYKNPPPNVQMMSGGDVYRMVVYWDRPQDKDTRSGGGGEEYFVFISADGKEIRALKCLMRGHTLVKAKRRQPDQYGGPHFFEVPNQRWKIPDSYTHWAKQNKEPVGDFLARLFTDTVKHFEMANYSMVRVAVSKKDLTAVFGVNVHKLGYFFQDRDIQLTVDGAKKRIFHIVRPHERHTKHGTKVVPFHFRGLREFAWADYQVKITVPGRDHFIFPDVNFGAVDEYWQEKDEKYVGSKEIGDRLAAIIDGR